MNISKNKKNQQKKCTVCSIPLCENNCEQYNFEHAKYICTECLKIYNQNKYQKHKQNIRAKQKQYEINNKQKIIQEYGGKCVCCGENRFEFLTIDHINNDGAIERKNTNQGTGGKLYRWLIKNNYPKNNYQLLCYNCNCAKGFFGYCPHQKDL
jgi:hypothetical protein